MHNLVPSLGLRDAFIALVFAAVIAVIFGGLRRLFLYPLAKFPGPRLAVLTGWYKAYYDIVKDGGLLERLEELHVQYGPVIRIGPGEVHFSNPQAHAAIYSQSNKFTKEPTFYQAFDQNGALFGMTSLRGAKTRKELLGPPFSRRSVLKLQTVIQQKVDTMIKRLSAYQAIDKPANIYFALRATSMDVIIAYCYARNVGVLDAPDFRHLLLTSAAAMIPAFWVLKHFPVLLWVMNRIPSHLAGAIAPEARGMLEIRNWLEARISELLKDPELLQRMEHDTIFHHLLVPEAGKGSGQIPDRKSLLEEATSLLLAGSDTVGNTCWVGSFHVLSNEGVRTKLVQELDSAWPDTKEAIGYEVLEKLPYLTAVIKESLRVAHGVVTPLPRVVGPSDTIIDGYPIPAGTIVSIGSTFLHNNEGIFPNHRKFIPERWLRPNARELERYLVPFSKGPRTCIGINLAWCEMYLIFGNMFRKLDLKLHNASVDDLKFREYFVPYSRIQEMNVWVRERAA